MDDAPFILRKNFIIARVHSHIGIVGDRRHAALIDKLSEV